MRCPKAVLLETGQDVVHQKPELADCRFFVQETSLGTAVQFRRDAVEFLCSARLQQPHHALVFATVAMENPADVIVGADGRANVLLDALQLLVLGAHIETDGTLLLIIGAVGFRQFLEARLEGGHGDIVVPTDGMEYADWLLRANQPVRKLANPLLIGKPLAIHGGEHRPLNSREERIRTFFALGVCRHGTLASAGRRRWKRMPLSVIKGNLAVTG